MRFASWRSKAVHSLELKECKVFDDQLPVPRRRNSGLDLMPDANMSEDESICEVSYRYRRHIIGHTIIKRSGLPAQLKCMARLQSRVLIPLHLFTFSTNKSPNLKFEATI